MKKGIVIIITAISGLTFQVSLAQKGSDCFLSENSQFVVDSSMGHHLPAFDTLKALYVYAILKDDQLADKEMRRDEFLPPPYADKLVSVKKGDIPEGSLTQYLHEASLGKFYYWAQVFPYVVTLDSFTGFYHENGQYGGTNKEILEKVIASGQVNWSALDQWSKFGNKWIKKPDGVIDNICIIYRSSPQSIHSKFSWIGAGGGVGALYGKPIRINETTEIRTGSLQSGFLVNGGNEPYPELLKLVKHELAHFYTLSHYGATNDQNGTDFMLHGSWGLAAASGSSSICITAWDRNYLGWRSYAANFDSTLAKPCTFKLRDFVTTGDAVRLKLPYVQKEYFYLEYHNNTGFFDKVDGSADGIYIFHQTGDGPPHHIDLEEADGRFDYALAGTEKVETYCCGKQWPIKRLEPNPFLGFGDRDNLLLDKDGDGNIGNNDVRSAPVLAIEGEPQFLHFTGDGNDGLTGAFSKKSFRIDSNPSTASNGQQNKGSKTVLNGISIQVIDKTKEFITISVDYNDFNIYNSVRWCGNIILNDTLILNENSTVLLDSSGTPSVLYRSRPLGNLEVQVTGGIQLKNKSEIIINPGCQLVLKAGSFLKMEKGSIIRIEKGGKLITEGAILNLDPKSKIIEK